MFATDPPDTHTHTHTHTHHTGLWRVPPTTGQGPPPAGGFTFTRVDLARAVFFGGDNAEIMKIVADVFLLNFETWVSIVQSL